jgi:hypothetical protein
MTRRLLGQRGRVGEGMQDVRAAAVRARVVRGAVAWRGRLTQADSLR